MTPDRFKPLLDREFLRAELHMNTRIILPPGRSRPARAAGRWATREVKRETQAEGSFVQRFFVETWGYRDTGRVTGSTVPQITVAGAGQSGIAARPIWRSGISASKTARRRSRRSCASSRTSIRPGRAAEPQGQHPLAGYQARIICGTRGADCSATSPSSRASRSSPT